jgi:hypothetical protein
MYVTLHGSWNRAQSAGYKIIEIPFAKGTNGYKPHVPPQNGSAWIDIFWNPDEEHCSTTQCFRPVSIAKDRVERMYITSDSGAEGELIILGRA